MSDDDDDERERLRRSRREAAEAKGYACGYAKPPEANRFSTTNQPQHRGRKPAKSRAEAVAAIADERVRVLVGGKSCWMTRHEVILRGVGTDAARGDPKARILWFKNVGSKLPEPHETYQPVEMSHIYRRIEEMAARHAEEERRKAGSTSETTSSDSTAAAEDKDEDEAVPGRHSRP